MTTARKSFSFPSYRRLYRYLGETDAMVELTELAKRDFTSRAEESGNIATFVAQASSKHGIRVNLSEMESISRHLSRNYIVVVYHSAERFLHEFRQEHVALYRTGWSGDGIGIDPLTVTLRNIAPSTSEARDKVGWDLISRFQYYRILRNWIVHTKDSDLRKPLEAYDEIVAYSDQHRKMFGSVAAPNMPEELNFDDFILFSRLTKLIGEKICRISKPTSGHWLNTISLARFKRLRGNPQRMRNAVAGRLRTECGLDEATAQHFAIELCDSLA